MTRSKIQRIKFFVFLLIFLLFQIATCDGNFREKYEVKEPVPSDKSKNDNVESIDEGVVLPKDTPNDASKKAPAQSNVNDASVNKSKKTEANLTSKAASAIVPTISPATSTVQTNNGMHIPSMNSGALMRGIFVVIGLSVLVMAYMVFRSLRLNKTRAQMVRKYGVLAHRQDVEMRPLPLDEDDEDDTTVFDASNISSHRLQSQNS